MSEMHDIDRRVAVLEEIARNTAAALIDIRSDLRQLRSEQREDFRFLFRVMIGGFSAVIAGFAAVLAVMAHGFHWL